MAVKNRLETLTQMVAKLVATTTLTILKSFLSEDFINSVVYRKDVIASSNPSGGSVTVDFSDKDLATINAGSSNIVISFTNLENGDSKYIDVTKQTGKTISFPGASNTTNYPDFVNAKLTGIVYRVERKNGNIYCTALEKTIIRGISSDIAAEDLYKFPTCKDVFDYVSTPKKTGTMYSPDNTINNYSLIMERSGLIYMRFSITIDDPGVVVIARIGDLLTDFFPSTETTIVGNKESGSTDSAFTMYISTSGGILGFSSSYSIGDIITASCVYKP